MRGHSVEGDQLCSAPYSPCDHDGRPIKNQRLTLQPATGWGTLNPRPLRPELGPGRSSACALGQICRSGRWGALVSVGASGALTQDHLQNFSKTALGPTARYSGVGVWSAVP